MILYYYTLHNIYNNTLYARRSECVLACAVLSQLCLHDGATSHVTLVPPPTWLWCHLPRDSGATSLVTLVPPPTWLWCHLARDSGATSHVTLVPPPTWLWCHLARDSRATSQRDWCHSPCRCIPFRTWHLVQTTSHGTSGPYTRADNFTWN